MAKRQSRPGEAGFTVKDSQPVDGGQLIEVAIPCGELVPGANARPLHIDVMLTREQSVNLRKILHGLRANKETCVSMVGRRRLVDSNQDVIRWLLEAV